MIHPTAYIDPSAVIAENVTIGPMAYVGAGCELAAGVKVGAKAMVERNTYIGEGTILSPNAHVGGDPQDLGYSGEETFLRIGKNNVIREFATMHRATSKEDFVTEVGDNNYFMAGSHVAHDCKIGNGVVIVNNVMLSGHIHVDDKAVISGLVGCHQFVRIGSMAMVAGLSRISKDVPPYCMIMNDSIIGLNVIGLRRGGVAADVRAELKRAVNIYTDKSLLLEEAKLRLGTLEQFPEIIKFRDFLEGSVRGVIRNLGSEN